MLSEKDVKDRPDSTMKVALRCSPLPMRCQSWPARRGYMEMRALPAHSPSVGMKRIFMTTTSAAHYVVDGSNIATKVGRAARTPQEAVTTFMADHPDAMITVVVDVTFGHRIDASERPEFDEAVANNELVAPPAGAIGRGDAFVLTIADRAGASVLSNDSFRNSTVTTNGCSTKGDSSGEAGTARRMGIRRTDTCSRPVAQGDKEIECTSNQLSSNGK